MAVTCITGYVELSGFQRDRGGPQEPGGPAKGLEGPQRDHNIDFLMILAIRKTRFMPASTHALPSLACLVNPRWDYIFTFL